MSRRQKALFLLLFAGAIALRWRGLETYPREYQTLDEYHFVWAGLSLLHDGRPTAWSTLDAYRAAGVPRRTIESPDGNLSMVTPALDHPPLFSVAAGAFARLTGARRILLPQSDGEPFPFWQIDLGRARLLPLFLFALSFTLLFAIARQSFSFEVACLAGLFYACTAHVVFHSRLIVTENLTTPLFLLNLFFFQRYTAGRSSRSLFATVTVLSTAAALLCKVIAVSQAAAIAYLLLLRGKRRDAIFPLAGALLGAGLYLLYGWWQGWQVFRCVLGGQAGRFHSFNALLRIITDPALVHTPNISYPLLAGWIALFAHVLYRRGSTILAAPLAYLLASIFFVSVPAIYGWHVVPFYPFLCLALGAMIARVYQRCEPLPYLALLAMLLPNGLDALALAHAGWSAALRLAYLAGTPILLALPLLMSRAYGRRVARLAVIVVVALTLIAELQFIWFTVAA